MSPAALRRTSVLPVLLALAVAVMAPTGASTGAPATGAPASAAAASVASSSAAAGRLATLTVLPPISQPGRKIASASKARTVVSASFKPATSGRPVVLARKKAGRWQPVARTTTVKGLAEFSVPTSRGRTTFRATAPAFRGRPAVGTKAVSSRGRAPDFVDEFDRRGLRSAWGQRHAFYNPWGLRNCAKSAPQAAVVTGGALRLSVLPDSTRADLCTAYRMDGSVIGQFPYRLNGHVATDGQYDFTFGVAAARMKFQRPRGQHASFWLQPTTLRPEATTAAAGGAEIDIIEWFGDNRRGGGLASFLYHPSAKGSVKVGGVLEDAARYLDGRSDRWWSRYHVYSVEWTPKAYVFRIDGKQTWRTTAGVSHQPEFLILSLLSSDYELENLRSAGLPQHAYVDWVQVWEHR